jgi:hypothetical protein
MKKAIIMTAATMVLGAAGCWGATVADMTGTAFTSHPEGSRTSKSQPLVVMAGAAGLIGLLLAKRKNPG